MSDDAFNPFKGESGLMNDVDLEFTNFRFARNPSFKRTLPDGSIDIPVIVMVDLVGGDETKTEFFSIGNGWETIDGTAVEKEDGKPHAFNASTRFQQIITRCIELDEEAMMNRWESTGLTPQTAGFWEGFTAHWEQEDQTITFGDKKGETRQVLMPTKVIGFDGLSSNGTAPVKAAAKKAPAKKAAAKKAAAKVEKVEVEADAGVAQATLDAIRAIADECDTHDEMVDRAYAELDGIGEDVAVQTAVEDNGPDSIWQAAVDAAS